MSRVLVIAPHMDDEVLGTGGAIARHVARGDEVKVCIVAHRVYGHEYDEEKNRFERECTEKARAALGYRETAFLGLPDERLDACLQEILVPLEEQVRAFAPEVVYIPHRGDLNQDHRAVFHASVIALRPHANPKVRRILSYEVPSSTDQAPPFPEYAFLPNCYLNITDVLDRKVGALRCYLTETRPFPHPRSGEGLITLARKRGMESGFPAAEAFMVVRETRD
jgi:LmbE family N-acetylglucosaminyl deacetylase